MRKTVHQQYTWSHLEKVLYNWTCDE